MRFILTGFTQDMGFRVFAFEKVGEDRTRTAYMVRADLALTRRYGIRMQELPLLCQALLERCENSAGTRRFTFTEEDMSKYANERAAEANALMEKRRAHRLPVSNRTGQAWRGSFAPRSER